MASTEGDRPPTRRAGRMTAPAAFARRAGTHLAWRARRLVDRLRRGDRVVLMTPESGMRFGNWLYIWLYAHECSQAGQPTLVREVDGMAPWLEVFPALRELTIRTEDLAFHDARVWNERTWNQRFGVDFSRASLDSFVRSTIGPAVRGGATDDLVVNVRRGDYYESDELRSLYGFDQVAYVEAAMSRIDAVERVRVVSDDPAWCRQNLDGLLRGRAAVVEYDAQDPVANFLAIAGARRLIGMNSTFSYWGGYVVGVLHPGAQIVFPRFHSRRKTDTDAHQLDPHWTVIEDVS